MTDTPSDKRNKANKSRAKIIKQGEALAREAIKHHVNGNLKKPKWLTRRSSILDCKAP